MNTIDETTPRETNATSSLPSRSRARRWIVAAAALPLVLALAAAILVLRKPSLPHDVRGALVYVSDRSGVDALYERNLETGVERILTHMSEPVRSPAVAPDGRRVAFEMGGRIGIVDRVSGETLVLTLGVRWRDDAPSWRPDGRAIVVASRRDRYAKADLHLLMLEGQRSRSEVDRRLLTQTAGLDETSPVFDHDGRFIVFVREDNLFRISADSEGRSQRLTGGFKKCRAPCVVRDGRLVFPWSLEKIHGIDRMEVDGQNRETLYEGTVHYADLSPAPNGVYLAATFSFDLAFHPMQALRLRKGEEIHILRSNGRSLCVLARSSRYANHSPDWTRNL